MAFAASSRCHHPDVRNFGEIRCCLSCGSARIPKVNWPLKQADTHVTGIPGSPITRYEHQPLHYELGKEVRLVTLQPGEFDDDLCCEISHKNLEDNPHYQAVSYTWADQSGDASLTKAVLCKNGGQIPITESCDGALRRIRLRGLKRVLWIDMLSIDQQNIQERNHQVSLMKEIYNNATEVLVDLGEGGTESDLIFSQIANLDNGHEGSASRESFKAFFRRRWFHRVWVLQEITLAQFATVFCGRMSMNWGSLASFMRRKRVELERDSFDNILPTVFQLRTTFEKTWSHARLLDLLVASRTCQSTDPRDKVYALLSLLDSRASIPIAVDYSQAPSSLFLQIALWCVNTRKDWDILLHVCRPSSLPSLPSWVPDWTLLPSLPNIEPYIPLLGPPFMQRCPISESSLSSTARVQGRKLGNIWALKDYLDSNVSFERRDHFPLPKYHPRNWLSPLKPCSHLNANSEFWSSIALENKNVLFKDRVHGIPPAFGGAVCSRCGWRSFDTSGQEYLKDTYNIHEASGYGDYLETSDREYPKDEISDCIYWLRTRRNRLKESVTKYAAELSKLRSCNMCLGLPNLKRWSPHEFYKFNSSSLDSFAKRLRETGKGRELFATEVSLGFGPNLMRTGDSVWLLESQQVPFILREHTSDTRTSVSYEHVSGILCEHASDTRTFEFIGACYLHEAARDHDLCAKCGAEKPRLLNEWQTINIK